MQVTSLPVPAVVGMTMCGVCGRVRSWIPSKFSRPPPSVSRMQIPFPVSMTLPPPTLTTQSAPFSRAKAAARFTIPTPVSWGTSLKTPTHFSPSAFRTPSTSPAFITPGSVTTSARLQPRPAISISTSRAVAGAEDDFRRTEIDKRQILIVRHGCLLSINPRPARWYRFHRADRSPCSRS